MPNFCFEQTFKLKKTIGKPHLLCHLSAVDPADFPSVFPVYAALLGM